jgi:hypothetical protein
MKEKNNLKTLREKIEELRRAAENIPQEEKERRAQEEARLIINDQEQKRRLR